MRPSSLCSRGPEQPLVLTGVCLSLARRVFSGPRQTDEPILGSVVYDADATKTGIRIETVYDFNAQDVQRKPAIYVKRGPASKQRISIGDTYIGAGLSLGSNGQSVDNNHAYTVLLQSGYTWFCIGKTGGAAEAIATELWLRLLEWSPLIVEDIGLTRFEVMQLAEVQKLEEESTCWVVPVSAAIAHQYKWKLLPQGPKLKGSSIGVE